MRRGVSAFHIFYILCILLLAVTIPLASAHEVNESQESASLTKSLVEWSVRLLYISLAIIVAAVIISLITGGPSSPQLKKLLFLLIAGSAAIATLYLAGSTIYVNIVSPTGGPVHWHADFMIEICGMHYELADPDSSVVNRVGSSALHEHNDLRIHIEGTPHSLDEFKLHNFFEQVGGELTGTGIKVPTPEGIVEMHDGDVCEGQGPGTFKVFVEKQQGAQRVWFQLSDPADYIISPYSTIPPGDRLLFVFDDKRPQDTLGELIGS